jgi:hypothetical protein
MSLGSLYCTTGGDEHGLRTSSGPEIVRRRRIALTLGHCSVLNEDQLQDEQGEGWGMRLHMWLQPANCVVYSHAQVQHATAGTCHYL